jgi:hypothetical protein
MHRSILGEFLYRSQLETKIKQASQLSKPKIFVSYHHQDQIEVDTFITRYKHLVHSWKGIGLQGDIDSIINSSNVDYTFRKIREDYLQDSTLTIVFLGRCTWARKYCDWELYSSLRNYESSKASGILYVTLPSAFYNTKQSKRLRDNIESGYAVPLGYNVTDFEFNNLVGLARNKRKNNSYLKRNNADRYIYNKPCI